MLNPIASPSGGLRATVGVRRAETPLAGEGPEERATAPGPRGQRPSGARYPYAARLPLNSRRTMNCCQTKD